MPLSQQERRFVVHARHVDRHHWRVIDEPSFEAAAVTYVEHLASPADDTAEVSVIVRDLDSGEEHCFRIDLSSEEVRACD